ncbi:MarR family transcriptional regulator [Nostoc sp. 'Peltigera membranacea cyanobiont' 210A]|uniref:ArsR family transcriptional regulator n=1 Tax=Nostoc sp. 'Peltigera membranacea cyanobiont' 210A TaxID=2014529 RepID=UPI000B9507AB|nr:ArsR family transcriptional regulator [Nostoc sp. 'Peltigera membranacea cyanobiont' 210A]OYD96276.1 MarR family transcriptional regulator [Nostoc sp. 'Peltigera membranacea cyanobiont' 210A]
MSYSESEKDNFLEAVASLKKYRRAELIDENGNNLLSSLYTDLLANEQILKTCLKGNTTFIIGRKGTGKSTIFLKIQQELRKKDNNLSCYVDAKTIFESSKSEYVNGLEELKNIISNDVLQNYLIERNFIQTILSELRKEIDKRSYTLIDKIKELFGTDRSSIVREKLQKLQNSIENNELLKSIELPLLQQISTHRKNANEKTNESAFGKNSQLGGKLDLKEQSINASYSENSNSKNLQKNATEVDKQFSDIFLKVFQVKDIITQIKDILSLLNVKSLIIIVDDFSEIDDQAMRVLIDVILAPLNNWSDEFIKFKIAAYPNRVYYGKIDKSKVDIVDLDFYNLYSELDRNNMEERAIDFTRRLVEKRIKYFTEKPAEYFFDTKKEPLESYYELIFQISMNVPRIIGYILFYCCERNIVFDKPINRESLEAASQKYFERNIEHFFDNTTYSMMSFDEKISILQLKELLQQFVDSLSNTRKKIIIGEITGNQYEDVKTNPYTSHFYFKPTYEHFLKTLELNFFISKYSERSDRNSEKQSIYCLNYGLCKKENLRWGKPKGSNYRTYFISKSFDFNSLIDDFLKNSKRIICINPKCKKSFPFEELHYLEYNKMLCPECHNPVNIISNSETIQLELEKIDKSKLLPHIELSILYEINKTEKDLKPGEIAEELDCSYQLIGKRAKKLNEEKKLILRMRVEGGKVVYKLTDKAKNDYFNT